MTDTQAYAALADELADMGYDRCIPLRKGDKAPRYKGWEAANASPVTFEQRAKWISRGQFDGIGMASGGHVFGLDLDQMNETAAIAVRELADEFIGPTSVWRIGQAPKSLRFYRQDINNPISTATLRELDVGLYGTTGQWVLYANHPITKQPYYYPDESPLTVHADDLPPITHADLDRFLTAIRPVSDNPDFRHTGAGQYGVAYDAQVFWENAVDLDSDENLGSVMADLMRSTDQRHPTMTGIVAFLCQCGWTDTEIIDAIAEPYLDHFRGDTREIVSRWGKLNRSIKGAHKKGIARDQGHLLAVTGFAKWGQGAL
jgi:hypothetical protein